MKIYFALIHKEEDSDYGVSFPDLPGCISVGSSMQEALKMAEEALALHIKGITEDGEKIPEPSSVENIARDNGDAIAIVGIPHNPMTLETKRINITIRQDILNEIDAAAELAGMSRSGFLAFCAQNQIQGKI